MITPEQELETQLRTLLAEIHRRAQAEAAPIIEQLAKLEAMKPPRPPLVYADLLPGLMAKHLAARVDDAKIAAINGHAITRTWTDEEGKLTSKSIDPEDFYAKPEEGK